MNSRPWCLALLLSSGSPLPAQQDPVALLALSHALDSKLAPDLSEWTVVADPGASGGTCLLGTPSNSTSFLLETRVTGPASLRFRAKGSFRYSAKPLDAVYGYTAETALPNNPTWGEYKINLPAGVQSVTWVGQAAPWLGEALLDSVTVAPLDGAAAQAAVDYPGPISFPGYGEWSVDDENSVMGTSSLRQPISGPSSLSFYTHQLGNTGFRLQVDDLDHAVIAAAPKYASYDITAPDWLESRIAIPRGDHKISWKATHTATKPFPQLFLLDTVRVQPLPIAEIAAALDTTLPWELDGPILPQVQVSNTATGGTLLASPAGRDSASRISLCLSVALAVSNIDWAWVPVGKLSPP